MKTPFIIFLSLVLLNLYPQQVRAQTGDPEGKGAALETIGAQGGALLYNTYCLIGAIHDGYLVEAWDKDIALRILDEQNALMTTISERYDTLLSASYLDEEDSLFLVDMKECCGLLKAEAIALQDYINNESSENLTKYDNARDAAWNAIEQLLGLNDEDYSGAAGRKVIVGTR